MIVKGIIKSIDVQGNTCVVRMPYFETAGNDEIIATATVSNSPGSYNGYKVDDVVWVAFENDQLECPVIIGKLYLGIEAERADPRGTLNVVDSKVSRTAEIPFDTKLGRNLEPGMPKTLAPYNSLNSIANNLSTAEVNIAQNDREYGNRFTVAFENIEGNRSSINQTADKLSTEIRERKNADTSLDTKITQTATDITNEVAATYVAQDGKFTSEAFGWSLKKDKWEVYKKINDKETPILVADKDGLEVTGKITAESGHIGKFIISDVHNCVIKDSEGNDTGKTFEASGIHSDDYITKFDDAATKRGVYVGTDGIKVGSNFSVDTSGVVTATELVLKPENVYLEDEYETDPSTGTQRRKNLKKRIEDGDTATETLKEILNQNLTDGGDITSTKITNEVMLSPYLIVDAANIRKTLTIGDIDEPLFHADIDDPAVTIGGFKVGSTGISSDTDTAKYNTTFGDSAVGDSGVYVGTDGIRLGKTFSVNPDGAVVATNLTITGNKTIETALSDTQSAAENTAAAALSTAQTTLSGQISDAEKNAREDAIADIVGRGYQDSTGVVNIIDGTITADYLAAKGIYTNQLEIYSKDGDPILLANVDDDKRVQIGGFEVNKDALNSGEVDGEQITLSTTGISLGTIDSEGNYPFMVACNGDISASKGSFTGSITATDASLTNINELSMADGAPASFDELTTRGNTSVGGRINTSNGYFFGAGTDCGFTLADASTKDQTVTFSITATCNLVGGGTNYRYSIRVTASAPLVASQTISHSAAVWGSGLNSVTIPAGDIIIAAGSTTGTTSRTVPNNDRFSDLKYTLDRIEMYGTEPSTYASTSNVTNLTTSPRITSASSITQLVTTNTGNITLTCNTLKVAGDAVQFKIGGQYYTPVVRLGTTGSPNCFWSTTAEISSNRWKRITLPSDIRGKVIAAVVSSCATKPSGTADSNNEIGGNRPTYDFSSLESKGVDATVIPDLQTGIASGMIANCLYVDYSSSTTYVWVFNGQKEKAIINLFVAAKI